MRYYSLLIFILPCFFAFGQSDRIILDENFEDWQSISVAVDDPSGDSGNSNIDFGRLWISNDSDYLFFRIELGEEINLQSDNDISFAIDTDNNINTGLQTNGIGAEIVYNLGNRFGTLYRSGNSFNLDHEDIQLVSSPTVSSEEFEIAIGRKLTFLGQNIFSGNTIKLFFKNSFGNADQIPDAIGGVSYSFDNSTTATLPAYSISQDMDSQLRIMSYNVLFDNLFDNSLQNNFKRIIRALDADIIGFQEIYDHNSQQTASKIQSFLPLGNGSQWHHAKIEPDIIAVSKFPIISSHLIASNPWSNKGNGAFLIDLDPATNTKLLFVVAHPPCCANDQERQQEIDALMAFIRNAKEGLGPLSLSENDPIIIVGDMNLVGLNEQQTTLISGDIVNESDYGNDFDPDWDGTSFEDAKPLASNLPMAFTWYDEGSSFSPGRLDYIVYSGSVLELKNSFTLFSPALSIDELTDVQLNSNDVLLASDHLPLVGDFDLDITLPVRASIAELFGSFEIYPNPYSDESKILLSVNQKSLIEIELLDINGMLLNDIYKGSLTEGRHEFSITKNKLANGVYLCRIKTAFGPLSKKIVVSR